MDLEAAHKAPDIIGLLIDLDRCRAPSRLPILPAKGEQIDNSRNYYQNQQYRDNSHLPASQNVTSEMMRVPPIRSKLQFQEAHSLASHRRPRLDVGHVEFMGDGKAILDFVSK